MNSVITMVSDYGAGSPYTAAMLGSALSLMPEARVIEISHHIPAFNLVQGAFLLRSVYKNFPKGTCHLICIDTSLALHDQILFVETDGHYFLGADNGIFSLLFDEMPQNVHKLTSGNFSPENLFPEKNIFLPFIAKFFAGEKLETLAVPGTVLNTKTEMQPQEAGNGISGTVIFVDGFNNAITNIHRTLFEKVRAGRKFRLYYWSKHSINRVSKHFQDAAKGEDLLLFNENDYLMLGMDKGKGAQLLGLKPGSNLVIEFENAEEGN